MTNYYYGINKRRDVLTWAEKILTIDALNQPYALQLMIETCAAETLLATFKDPTPTSAGASLCQIDEGTFHWLQDEYSTHWLSNGVGECLGVDIDEIEYHELNNNPDYGFLFCLLRYHIEDILDDIPDMQHGRGQLWKEYFNTSAGKGTVEGYIEKCQSCHTDDLIEGAGNG